MCDKERIAEFLQEHIGETKYLADWATEINKLTRKKHTKREIAFVFNREMPRLFTVEKQDNPIQYSFSPLFS